MGLEHRTLRHRQSGLNQKSGEERDFDLQRPGYPGKGDIRVLPVLHLGINKPPDLKQPHPDAPVPHFGLRDEELLVCDSQRRYYVEACCLPQTRYFGANRCEHQEEMNTGTHPYFTLPITCYHNW